MEDGSEYNDIRRQIANVQFIRIQTETVAVE